MKDANEEKPSSRDLRARARKAGTEVPAEGNAPVNEDTSAFLSGIVQESDQLQALAPVPAMGGTTPSGTTMSKKDEIVKRLDAMMSLFTNMNERVTENKKAVSRLSPPRPTNPSLILGSGPGGMDRGTPRVESEPTVQSALSGESANHISRRSENMERHLPSASFSASPYSPICSYQRTSRQFPTMGDLSMDIIYESGEWPWRKPLEIISLLKKRLAYNAWSLGIEMEGGNINLLQQRVWVAQESIKESTPSLSRFDDFLQSYENYRREGGRPRTIISYKM
jgi:hypothetical protein